MLQVLVPDLFDQAIAIANANLRVV